MNSNNESNRIDHPFYCPNPNCKFHNVNSKNFYTKYGTTKTLKSPYINQRYRCKNCGKQFSQNTFSIDFRKRIVELSPSIFELRANGMTYTSISKSLHVSEGCVRLRCGDLARQAMIKENILGENLVLNESVAYDGFETFSNTKFSICYINTAVGSDSFYTFATTYSPLNRKGRMTKWQKEKKKGLEKKFGKYPTSSVREQTTYILKKLISYSSNDLLLYTDEHKAYQSSINQDLADEKIIHKTINSKEKRNASNPLFPVNHLHLTYRHFNSAHRRSGISFHKHEAGIMDSITINRIHKNFMRSKFLRNNVHDKKAGIESPAMKIGLAKSILRFEEFFDYRRQLTHARFDEQEVKMYKRDWDFSRFNIAPYLGG
jgi:transposase-like protein